MAYLIKRINKKEKFLAEKLLLIENSTKFFLWDLYSFKVELRKKRLKCFVAIEEKNIIGFILFQRRGKKVHVFNIAIHPSHKRKGIGKALMNKIKNKNIILEVDMRNLEAIKFYYNLGFVVIGKKINYYGKELGAYVMEKK